MPKQFLLICDENGMKVLQALAFPNLIQFLEVQGMKLNGEDKYNLLVTPIVAPFSQTIAEPTPQEAIAE